MRARGCSNILLLSNSCTQKPSTRQEWLTLQTGSLTWKRAKAGCPAGQILSAHMLSGGQPYSCPQESAELVTFHLKSVGSPLQSCTAGTHSKHCCELLAGQQYKASWHCEARSVTTLFTWHSNFVE